MRELDEFYVGVMPIRLKGDTGLVEDSQCVTRKCWSMLPAHILQIEIP
jgi:hypothetical protein